MTSTISDTAIFEDIVSQIDPGWSVIILDDDTNSMEYVTAVFMDYFKLTLEVATQRMWEVHSTGRSILDFGERDSMLNHKRAMNDYGLQSMIEQNI